MIKQNLMVYKNGESNGKANGKCHLNNDFTWLVFLFILASTILVLRIVGEGPV